MIIQYLFTQQIPSGVSLRKPRQKLRQKEENLERKAQRKIWSKNTCRQREKGKTHKQRKFNKERKRNKMKIQNELKKKPPKVS